jgi:hypothetical protein
MERVMSRLRRIAGFRVSRESWDVRVAQAACFAASPAVLLLAVRALARNAATPGEMVVGLLAAVAVSLLCVILGLVLPLAHRRASA